MISFSLKHLHWLLTSLSLASPLSASAWWDGGHKVIAQLAYQRLSPAERQWVIDLLRQHPTYPELFAAPMLAELGPNPSADDQQRWMFSQAAVWADLVRYSTGYENAKVISEAFSHGARHYTDLPVYASESDRQELEPTLETPATKWSPGMAEPRHELNSMQTLAKGIAEIGNLSLPAADRSVELTWLFHLIGDTHQPCHCAQLFLPDKLPEGDRGANSVLIMGIKNQSFGMTSDTLHAFWDSLFNGETNTHADILARTTELETLAKAWPESTANVTAIDPILWWREGYQIAVDCVYTPPVLERLSLTQPQLSSRGSNAVMMIALPAAEMTAYATAARSTAQTQVFLAAQRLASTLQHLHRQGWHLVASWQSHLRCWLRLPCRRARPQLSLAPHG